MIVSAKPGLRTVQVSCVLATLMVATVAWAQQPVAPAPAAGTGVVTEKPDATAAEASAKPDAAAAAASAKPEPTPAVVKDKPEAAPGVAKPKPITAIIGAPSGWNRANTWDLELEGALGSTLGEGHRGSRFARARAGYLAVRDEMLYALTVSYQYANLVPHTFGLQAEFTNDNTGFWVQVGGLLDTRAHPGVMLATGLTLFGAEAEYRRYDDIGAVFTLCAKIRIPIGILAYQLR